MNSIPERKEVQVNETPGEIAAKWRRATNDVAMSIIRMLAEIDTHGPHVIIARDRVITTLDHAIGELKTLRLRLALAEVDLDAALEPLGW